MTDKIRDKLKDKMSELQLSMQDVADFTGLQYSHIIDVFRGKVRDKKQKVLQGTLRLIKKKKDELEKFNQQLDQL